MNPLLQITKTEILERQLFSKDIFADKCILAAVEAYALQGSSKRRAQDFINALLPLWKYYRKETYVPMFKNFVEFELGLESFEIEYAAHVNHVIQEFLFGYNILLKCQQYLDDFDYENGRKDPHSKFGTLFFSWMAAALFHDIGYDIEKVFEEESFRKKKNSFWDFMTKRSITDNPLTFSDAGPGRKLLEEYILREIKKIPGVSQFSYVEFEDLFKRQIPEQDWVRYDHGVVSALRYLTELQKLETKHGGTYLGWEPNKQAALAMALHNFRYKKVDLRLSSTNPHTLLAYFLVICDEIQEWGRGRVDADAELPETLLSGKGAERETKLIGVSFKPSYAYVVLDHRLKDSSLRGEYENYLYEKISLQKLHFPIRVLFAVLERKLRKEILKKTITISSQYITPLALGRVGALLIDLIPEMVKELHVPTSQLRRLKKIAETRTEKHLLVPSAPNPIYEIYVDHRIDSEPFLVTVFPF